MIYIKVPVNNECCDSENDKLQVILDKYDKEIKEKVIQLITNVYFNSMQVLDKRNLISNRRIKRPRIDYFLESLFLYLFAKMHKGNREKAIELIGELEMSFV